MRIIERELAGGVNTIATITVAVVAALRVEPVAKPFLKVPPLVSWYHISANREVISYHLRHNKRRHQDVVGHSVSQHHDT